MKHLIYAIISLIVLVYATWSAQEHLTRLRLFQVPEETTTIAARVSLIETPQLREGETGEHLRARVEISYAFNDKKFGRVLMVPLDTLALKEGDNIDVVVVKRAPEMVLTTQEMNHLDDHISGMQMLVFGLGLAALVVPFGVAGFGRRKQKKKSSAG